MLSANRWTRLLDFNAGELLLLARLAVEAPFRRRALLRRDLLDLGYQERTGIPNADAATVARARRLGTIVNLAVNRTSGPDNCLLRSTMLSRLLEQRAIAHTVRLGAPRDMPFSLAHAWVEVAGEPVNDTAENIARFAPFLPVAKRAS